MIFGNDDDVAMMLLVSILPRHQFQTIEIIDVFLREKAFVPVPMWAILSVCNVYAK